MPRPESLLPLVAFHPVPRHRASPAAAEPGITVKRDITYGEVAGVTLLLDSARPPTRETPRPAVLLFHGGAWMYGVSGRPAMDGPALALAQAGYVTFNVEYRRTRDPAGAHAWPTRWTTPNERCGGRLETMSLDELRAVHLQTLDHLRATESELASLLEDPPDAGSADAPPPERDASI